MNEFLHYEIFGIISVQAYLICTFVAFVFLGLIAKKGADFTKILCKAFVWPYVVVLLILIALGSLFVGILTIAASVMEKRRK